MKKLAIALLPLTLAVAVPAHAQVIFRVPQGQTQQAPIQPSQQQVENVTDPAGVLTNRVAQLEQRLNQLQQQLSTLQQQHQALQTAYGAHRHSYRDHHVNWRNVTIDGESASQVIGNGPPLNGLTDIPQ